MFAQERFEFSGVLLDIAADGDFTLVRRIIDVFLADTEAKVESLGDAVFPADFAEARRTAHSLKGAAVQIGTLRLANAAGQLERCAPEIDGATFFSLVKAIAESWWDARRSVIDALESMSEKPA